MSISASTVTSVSVATANTAQTKAALSMMKLPPAMGGVPGLVWLTGPSGRWTGAGVLYPMKPNAAGWIIVRPPFRCKGDGSALLGTLIENAREMGCQTLRAPSPLGEKPVLWLGKRGFSCFERVKEYAVSINEMLPRLERAWKRVSRQMPETAEIITLDEAFDRGLGETVSRFFALNVGGLPMHLMRLIRQVKSGQNAPLDLKMSLVLLNHGEVIGAGHSHFDRNLNCWYTDSIAVTKSYRRGWANILLRMERAKLALADGRSNITRFRFRDSQSDTSRFAEHVGAVKTADLALMEFVLYWNDAR